MNKFDVQTAYWNKAAASKTFTHPIPIEIFRKLLSLDSNILDYGCGYGRSCSELIDAGYFNVVGIDISEEMIKRGKGLYDNLNLHVFDGKSANFENESFDACILLAVLTCIPHDDGQNQTIDEIHRLLRPGGILFVSDYPLQSDQRNQIRYREFEKEFGTFGIFRNEGAVFRHFDENRISQLLSEFKILWKKFIRVCTMNGNESDVFQIAARKK